MNATGPSAVPRPGPSAKRDSCRFTNRHAPDRCQLHEQIVRVLAIDERPPVERLTSLEDLAISVFATVAGSRLSMPVNVNRPATKPRLAMPSTNSARRIHCRHADRPDG